MAGTKIISLVWSIFCFNRAAVNAEHVQEAIRRGSVTPKGVNLGGWLVAEYWMTYDSGIWRDVPEATRLQGEHATMTFLGHEKGDGRFEEHRANWITKKDIAELSGRGLNCVRVPVGYWIKDSDGAASVFAPGGLKYLDNLIFDWANKHNVAVLISFHAHRGSQNGRDHSATPVASKAQWSDDPANVENSIDVATFLADRYKNAPAFLGLGMMNEPEYPTKPDVVRSYFKRTLDKIRATGNMCVLVTAPMLSEQRSPHYEDFMKNAANVWHEWHPYYKWGYEGKTEGEIIRAAAEYENAVRGWQGNPLTISEWSMGVHEQSSPFHDVSEYKKFGQTMLQSFKTARGGYFFWSWRHSDDGHGIRTGWSMRAVLRSNLLTI